MNIMLHRKNKGHPSNISYFNQHESEHGEICFIFLGTAQKNQHISYVLYLKVKDIDSSMKYIGFYLTVNDYDKKDYL